MSERITIGTVAPDGYAAVFGLERYVRANVEHTLLELIKIRASMSNGCAFCVDMHTTDALAAGEDVRRVVAVSAWRESTFFTERERAVLALTDELTRLDDHGVRDETWRRAHEELGDKGVADAVLAIGTINLWNRIAISSHARAPELVARG